MKTYRNFIANEWRDAVDGAMLQSPEDIFRFVPAETEVPRVSGRVEFAPGLLSPKRVAVELFPAEEMGDGIADEEDLRLRTFHGGAAQLVAFLPVVAGPAPVLGDGHHGAGQRFLTRQWIKGGLHDIAHRLSVGGKRPGLDRATAGKMDGRQVGIRFRDGIGSIECVEDLASLKRHRATGISLNRGRVQFERGFGPGQAGQSQKEKNKLFAHSRVNPTGKLLSVHAGIV